MLNKQRGRGQRGKRRSSTFLNLGEEIILSFYFFIFLFDFSREGHISKFGGERKTISLFSFFFLFLMKEEKDRIFYLGGEKETNFSFDFLFV